MGDFNTPSQQCIGQPGRGSRRRRRHSSAATTGSHPYLWNIPLNSSRKCIPSKCLWNIYQERPCSGHKTNLNKFKRIESIQSLFTNHNGIKLGISNRKVSAHLETKQHTFQSFLGRTGTLRGNPRHGRGLMKMKVRRAGVGGPQLKQCAEEHL